MQEESYHHRDFAYSAWHRRKSTSRFIGVEKAQLLAMIDLDVALYVEYDDKSKDPVALIETAMFKGHFNKPATVTRKLAERADIPAYVVLYQVSDSEKNPADVQSFDIVKFYVKRLYPRPDEKWQVFSPAEYAEALLKIREWQAKHIDAEIARTTGQPEQAIAQSRQA